MTFGNTIAQYRKKRNMTQEQLANLLEVTNQAVSKWESDQCCPDIQLLPRLADLFEITMDELFGREQKEKPQTVAEDLPWPDDNILRVVMYVGHTLAASAAAGEGVVVTHEDSGKRVISVISVKPGKNLVLTYEGDVDGVLSVVSVNCGDVAGDVSSNGTVNCCDVGGDVDAGGWVNCATVGGDVDAGGNINCASVGGDADAGGDIICADVGGDADAGKNIKCGDVGGDVDAGANVECGEVSGDVDAGGTVTILKK